MWKEHQKHKQHKLAGPVLVLFVLLVFLPLAYSQQMIRFIGLFLALQTLPDLTAGVERLFERMTDFSADFVQIFDDGLNRKQQEGGHLYLKRSRMMRWEYKVPEEKYFISDGKTVYFYVPADKQVNREAAKDTFDDRMPLMFLLGKSNLRSEFTRFELLNAKPALEGTKVIRMFPRRKTDLKEVVMEVDPANYHIRRLRLVHNGGSQSEFIFSNIRTNIGLKASLFDFKVPPGVQVVEGIGQ
jgi:outer membrane lipoprotein carrier protein